MKKQVLRFTQDDEAFCAGFGFGYVFEVLRAGICSFSSAGWTLLGVGARFSVARHIQCLRDSGEGCENVGSDNGVLGTI